MRLRNIQTIIALLVLALLAACSPAPTASESSTAATETITTASETGNATSEISTAASESTTEAGGYEFLPPVEKLAPETRYASAFEGQTRAPGLSTRSAYKVDLLTDQLNSPWGITALPDGRLAITEKSGSMRLVNSSGELTEAIYGFPPLATDGQGGLLDVAASPDFVSSRYLYFTYSLMSDQGSATAVGRARLNEEATALDDFETLFIATPYHSNGLHFGSRIAFDQAGNLFVSTGERSDLATRANAQDLQTGHGKILYLTPDGEPVEGAPWVQGQAWPEIYSYGHRNVQGLAIHPETGQLWASEMGPRGGDELNQIKPGLNYGWPLISYGIEYSGAPVGPGQTSGADLEQPVYYWDPVIAPSGMTFYASGAIPEWQNNLFIGGLRGSHIARMVMDGDRVVGEERLLADLGERFRDLETADGALFAITDSGKLYRLAP